MNRRTSQSIASWIRLPEIMSSLFSCFLILFLTATATAQHYSANPKPQDASRPRKDTAKVMDVREKLVQLAMQNPSFEVADRQVNKSLYELKKAKGSWLNPLMATGNINEFSLNQDPNVPNFYPRYNFSVTVPLDLFSTKKNEVKIARENVLIAEAEKNQRYRLIRAEVLTAYEDYLMYEELLDIQARITQDQATTYATREKDYQDGLINSEELNKYYSAWSGERSKLVEARRNLNNSKIAIESMIGIPLEQAIGTK